jgi:hypothetical protein
MLHRQHGAADQISQSTALQPYRELTKTKSRARTSRSLSHPCRTVVVMSDPRVNLVVHHTSDANSSLSSTGGTAGAGPADRSVASIGGSALGQSRASSTSRVVASASTESTPPAAVQSPVWMRRTRTFWAFLVGAATIVAAAVALITR